MNKRTGFHLLIGIFLFFACTQNKSANESDLLTWQTVQDSSEILVQVEGLSGPESVRYDPDQDAYFVSNFNGSGGVIDSNGFISKINPDGTVNSLKFMTGTEDHPMHSPSGMYITGDTLWACDRKGIQGFNRKTGTQVRYIDLTQFDPGFLNDIVAGTDGALYVTDTGTSRVYRIKGNTATIVQHDLPKPPNGITIEPESEQLVLAPLNGGQTFYSWNPPDTTFQHNFTATGGGNFDGIEFYAGKLLATSQQDSTLRVITDNDHTIAKLPGKPADLGIDTERMRTAIPFIARNEVDIWQLPMK